MRVVVLIPAYNPDAKLLALVEALAAQGLANTVIVNDGSASRSNHVFESLERDSRCTVLTHRANRGKGRALKTGMAHIYFSLPQTDAIVTVDADGQHLPQDVASVASRLPQRPRVLIIGTRRFGKGTPFRSLIGNVVTRHLFRLLVGRQLSDTQSGLRCFSIDLVPPFLELAGERFEYELNMLLAVVSTGIEVIEHEISTVYIEGNRSAHFRPVVDSCEIYSMLMRYMITRRVGLTRPEHVR